MKGALTNKLLLWPQLLILFVLCTCMNVKKKDRTVLILDSMQVGSFKNNQARVKYMSDDGLPEVRMIEGDLDKILVNANRENIELALQDNNTVTQYFLIKKGDSVLLTEIGDNWGLKIINRDVLPFDENYCSQQDTFSNERESEVDEFYRACAQINSGVIHPDNKADLFKALLEIRDKVIKELPRRKKNIDSLVEYRLMSPEVAAFYKLKNTFDSVKISNYIGSRPACSSDTFLEPFKAISNYKTRFSWIHLTFYDDWFDIFINQFYTEPNNCKRTGSAGTLYAMIRKNNKTDSLLANTLLRKENTLILNGKEVK